MPQAVLGLPAKVTLADNGFRRRWGCAPGIQAAVEARCCISN